MPICPQILGSIAASTLPNIWHVLVTDNDPDAPAGLWTHWLVWNLPATVTVLAEGKLPPDAQQGRNSFGHACYDGPAPPSGTHRYFFHLYALDTTLALPSGSDRSEIKAAMQAHADGCGTPRGPRPGDPKPHGARL